MRRQNWRHWIFSNKEHQFCTRRLTKWRQEPVYLTIGWGRGSRIFVDAGAHRTHRRHDISPLTALAVAVHSERPTLAPVMIYMQICFSSFSQLQLHHRHLGQLQLQESL